MKRPKTKQARIETGVVRFGSDWPGVFIRGDDAFDLQIQLKALLKSAPDDPELVIPKHVVQTYIRLLQASRMGHEANTQALKNAEECLSPSTEE